jgi:hypothetical protein
MKFNLTYLVAGLGIVWAIVGMAFGWESGVSGSAIIVTCVGVFGARASQNTPVAGKGVW